MQIGAIPDNVLVFVVVVLLPSALNSNSLKLMMDLVGVAAGVTGAECVRRVWQWWHVMTGWLIGVIEMEWLFSDDESADNGDVVPTAEPNEDAAASSDVLEAAAEYASWALAWRRQRFTDDEDFVLSTVWPLHSPKVQLDGTLVFGTHLMQCSRWGEDVDVALLLDEMRRDELWRMRRMTGALGTDA